MHTGVITIAQGKKRYLEMAINLSISLKLNCSHLPIAVITDSKDPELKKYFDHIIPINGNYGTGLVQKLHIYEYSVFRETLFIDADCLLVRSPYFLIDLFKSHDISCIGYKRTEGKLFGLDAKYLMEKFRTAYIIGHNGGVYYFKKCRKAQDVFEKAIDLLKEYDNIGIEKLRGNINEEPLLAIAMSIYGIEPVDDNGEGMRSLVGQKGVIKIDALSGLCEFYKYGEKVNPAIMHFGGSCSEGFLYRREALKLKLVYNYKLPKKLVSMMVNVICNLAYIVYGFALRRKVDILGFHTYVFASKQKPRNQ